MGRMPQQEVGSSDWAVQRLSMGEEEEEAGSQESTPGGGSSLVPIKRKRGRPRKYPRLDDFDPRPIDRNLNDRQTAASSYLSSTFDRLNDDSNLMIGQVVHGTLDAAFDAGYLLTVQVGSSDTTLRGVVFKPGNFIPISPANDIAPGVRMIRRKELPSGGRQVEMTLPKSNTNNASSVRTPPPAWFSNNGVSVGNTPPLPCQDGQVVVMPWETPAETSCRRNQNAAAAPPLEPNSTVPDHGTRFEAQSTCIETRKIPSSCRLFVNDSAISVQDYASQENKVLSTESAGTDVQLDLAGDCTTCRTDSREAELFQEKKMDDPEELAEDQVGPVHASK